MHIDHEKEEYALAKNPACKSTNRPTTEERLYNGQNQLINKYRLTMLTQAE